MRIPGANACKVLITRPGPQCILGNSLLAFLSFVALKTAKLVECQSMFGRRPIESGQGTGNLPNDACGFHFLNTADLTFLGQLPGSGAGDHSRTNRIWHVPVKEAEDINTALSICLRSC